MQDFAQKQDSLQPQTSPHVPEAGGKARAASHQPHLMHLQHTIGNQAVLRLMRANAIGPHSHAGAATSFGPNLGHDFGRAPARPRSPAIVQTKLTVNSPGDVYEQEADNVSEQVMRAPEPQLQRACACGGTCDDCQKKQSGQHPAPLQMKRSDASAPGQTEAPPSVHQALQSPGQPLDSATRAFMEPRFGQDFSHVRVHAGEEDAHSADAIQARAYTAGSDVVFAGNQFSPTTTEGKKLLAHELTHVAQQAPGGTVQRDNGGSSADVRQALDIYPSEIRFEPTRIGRGTYRQVSISNHTPTPAKFGGFWGSSSGPPALAPAPPLKKGEDAPAPAREAPKLLSAHYAYDGPFKVIDDPAQRTIKAGGSIEAWVDFVPTTVGIHKGMFSVLSSAGEAIGIVSLVGEGLERQPAQNSASDSSPVVDQSETPVTSKDPKVNAARERGLVLLGGWQAAAVQTIVNNHNAMVGEWNKYIRETSSNPVLSLASVPDPAFLAMLAEHTVGGLAAKKAEHLIEHMAGHLAAEGAEAVGAGMVGAEVGSIAGPPGALIGFAVGVLIETVCGMLFHWLSGEDEEIKRMLQEQHEIEETEISRRTGELIGKKSKELDGTEDKALRYQNQQRKQYERLIVKSTDLHQLRRLIAEVEAQTDLAKQAQPQAGFADALLGLWVREYAAGPAQAGKEVNKKQWEKVAQELEDKRIDQEEIDGSLKQPDLFVAQCMHEWTRRGLAPTSDLESKLRGELAQLGVSRTMSQPEEPGHLAGLAEKARQRFDRREFVWTNVFDFKGLDNLDRMKEVTIGNKRHIRLIRYEHEQPIPLYRKDDQGQEIVEGLVDMIDQVLCYPVLTTDGQGACFVGRFDYRLTAYGKTWSQTVEPGGTLDFLNDYYLDPKERPQQTASAELYEIMHQIAAAGLTVTPEANAAENQWLQNMFGPDVAVPGSQHGDARPEPVSVYRLEQAVVLPSKEQQGVSQQTLPESVWAEIKPWAMTGGRFELAWQGRYLMVRGGNTILILETLR
jgi:hypothetical protein